MANLNKPALMNDELLFSYIYRTAERNGLSISNFLKTYVYGTKTIGKGKSIPPLSYGMNLDLTWFAYSMDKNAAELFWNATLYPLISMLVSKEQQAHIVNYVFRGVDKYPRIITPIQTDISTLRYCPVCQKEEIEEHGFFWYHCSHNIPGVQTCHKHQIPLNVYTGLPKEEFLLNENCHSKLKCADLEMENKISSFANELLFSNLDCSYDFLKSSIRVRLDDQDVQRRFDELCGRLFSEDISWKKWRKTLLSSGHLNSGFLIRSLFIVYEEVENIKPNYDFKATLDFFDSSSDYLIYEPLRTSIVTMRKKTEESLFVTTPYGFTIGWRSPYSDDTYTEQEKYKDLLKQIKDDEYEPISEFQGMVKPVTVKCKKCGKPYRVIPKRLLEEGIDCPCRIRVTLEGVQKEFNNSDFTVLALSKERRTPILTIQCNHCKQNQIIGYRAWKKDQYCRNCMYGYHKTVPNTSEGENSDFITDKMRRRLLYAWYGLHLSQMTAEMQKNIALIEKYMTGDYDVEGFRKFEKARSNLTGAEYETVGIYVNKTTPIVLLHTVCGHLLHISPHRFLRGERCPCRLPLIKHDFEQWVYDFTNGLYTCELDKSSYGTVENNVTHEKVRLKKRIILQELLRPTPSEILPIDEKRKNRAISPYISGRHGRKT